MSEEKKYPRVIVGAFIFNEKEELFLIKSVQWKGLYTCPGGKVELDETILEAVKREVMEETNIKIENLEFISVSEGLKLIDNYTKPENHLIFLNYKAVVKDAENIKLNEEGTEYRWKRVEEWLKKDNIAPTAREVMEKSLIKKESDDMEYKPSDAKALEDKYMRALADYQNLLKQTAKEKSEFSRFANEMLITEIIPIYDNLKTALNHLDEDAKKNGLAEGIKHIAKQMKDVLEANGVEEIKTEGEKFDHNTMEAIEAGPSASSGQGESVKKEVRAGYKLYGKVIVSAKVILE